MRDPAEFGVDFRYLLNMIEGAFMSRRNTLVVPGDQAGYAAELVLGPKLLELLTRRRTAL